MFRKLIISGELEEGDYLQPERKLLQVLDVSRPTLRETLRMLKDQPIPHNDTRLEVWCARA